jgi:putative hydrolase of the HAD superfamily
MQQAVNSREIKALFLDIGGVLLTNGWGHDFRARAVEKFGLDKKEFEDRHSLVFDNYELGRVSFDEYLDWVVFYQQRDFSKKDFTTFIFEQSEALDGHLDYFMELKQKHQLKVFAVSNEGREINEYRVKKFRLDDLFDGYISSCYVGLHKPGKDILQMACDISHTPAQQALYVDDRKLLVDVAGNFGLQVLHFQSLDQAKEFIKTCTFYK